MINRRDLLATLASPLLASAAAEQSVTRLFLDSG